MKKILLLSFTFFALTSCFDNNTKIEGLPTKEFAESNFTMQIPNEWAASGSVDNLPSLPNGEVVLAAVSPEKKYNFSNNIIVISSKLDYIGTSKQYSEQNNLKTQKKYLEYSLVKFGQIILVTAMKENIIFLMRAITHKRKNYDFCKLQKYVEPPYFCFTQA